MTPKRRKAISKTMAHALRHHPEAYGLVLDEAGWVLAEELLTGLRRRFADLSVAELKEVVDTNPKRRFEVEGERIRARQGHSIDVNLGYEPAEPPEFLYHGTPERNRGIIAAEGLKPMGRHHVHLSPDVATARAVAHRRGRAVIFEVRATELAACRAFYRTGNGVWLVDAVPCQFLSVLDEKVQ